MKLAVSNLAWAGGDARSFYQLLADLNITGVEVAPSLLLGEGFGFGSADGVHSHRAMLSDFGLSVAGLQSLYYGHPEFQFADGPEKGRRLVAHSERLVDLCCEFGASYLLIGSPTNRTWSGLEPSDAEKGAAETLRRIGEYARNRGVWFTVEALGPHYGCQLGCTLADIARLIDMADTTGVRPHLDTGTTDPSADNPFSPADLGSAQVSARGKLPIVDDPDQYQWARFLSGASGAPQWLSLELPPSKCSLPEQNFVRIALAVQHVRKVFVCG